MRGKLYEEVQTLTNNRIIPAHAGQTVGRLAVVPACADHPRACGANRVLGQHVDTVAGSSPRMRGKPVV